MIHINKMVGQGQYQYWINNYTWFDGPIRDAKVQVIDDTGVIAEVEVPANSVGNWWHVLNINAETGQFAVVNQVGNLNAPYYYVNLGCPAPTGQFRTQSVAAPLMFDPNTPKPVR